MPRWTSAAPSSRSSAWGACDDPADRRPGFRLWVYTNFHCNLACDYCCVESSPSAAPRVIAVDEFERLVGEAVDAGVAELFLTGGEPFGNEIP